MAWTGDQLNVKKGFWSGKLGPSLERVYAATSLREQFGARGGWTAAAWRRCSGGRPRVPAGRFAFFKRVFRLEFVGPAVAKLSLYDSKLAPPATAERLDQRF